VLHRTIEVPAAPASTIPLLEDLDRWLLNQALARVLTAHPDLDVRAEADQNGAAHELVQLGAHAAMLVVGSPSSPRRASTLRGVLQKARCPVVVVPGRSAS
jgi:nucleotide-binding universal stress UspA family protein